MNADLSSAFDRCVAREWLEDKVARGKRVTMTVHRDKKTIPQLRYYRKVLAIYGGRFGSSPDDSAKELKLMFGLACIKGGEFLSVSVADMDTKQLSEFIEKIRRHSMEQGKYIETSEEYLKDQFNIDRDLALNEKYYNV